VCDCGWRAAPRPGIRRSWSARAAGRGRLTEPSFGRAPARACRRPTPVTSSAAVVAFLCARYPPAKPSTSSDIAWDVPPRRRSPSASAGSAALRSGSGSSGTDPAERPPAHGWRLSRERTHPPSLRHKCMDASGPGRAARVATRAVRRLILGYRPAGASGPARVRRSPRGRATACRRARRSLRRCPFH
jgi:hypothetical protein